MKKTICNYRVSSISAFVGRAQHPVHHIRGPVSGSGSGSGGGKNVVIKRGADCPAMYELRPACTSWIPRNIDSCKRSWTRKQRRGSDHPNLPGSPMFSSSPNAPAYFVPMQAVFPCALFRLRAVQEVSFLPCFVTSFWKNGYKKPPTFRKLRIVGGQVFDMQLLCSVRQIIIYFLRLSLLMSSPCCTNSGLA